MGQSWVIGHSLPVIQYLLWRQIGMSVLCEYICDCRMFRTLPHFSHVSAKCAYRIFFSHKLAFSTAILTSLAFILPMSIRFRYLDSTIWLPTEWHHPCVRRIPVERDRVVGFKQFCTIYPHISVAYLAFMRCAYF